MKPHLVKNAITFNIVISGVLKINLVQCRKAKVIIFSDGNEKIRGRTTPIIMKQLKMGPELE